MSGRNAEMIRQNRFGAALARFAVPRRTRRGREKRGKPEMPPARAAAASVARHTDEPDPVQIAVLALQTLGPASMRASCTGTEVRVTAPDEATAEIFRAALAETGRNRATDRLIRVVLGQPDPTDRAVPDRRVFQPVDHFRRLGGAADMRHDDAERAAVEI